MICPDAFLPNDSDEDALIVVSPVVYYSVLASALVAAVVTIIITLS